MVPILINKDVFEPSYNDLKFIVWNCDYICTNRMFKLDLEKAEEPETKLPTSAGSSKKQEFQKNIYFCFIDYAKAFDCVDHNKLWKILKEMGIPPDLNYRPPDLPLERPVCRSGSNS